MWAHRCVRCCRCPCRSNSLRRPHPLHDHHRFLPEAPPTVSTPPPPLPRSCAWQALGWARCHMRLCRCLLLLLHDCQLGLQWCRAPGACPSCMPHGDLGCHGCLLSHSLSWCGRWDALASLCGLTMPGSCCQPPSPVWAVRGHAPLRRLRTAWGQRACALTASGPACLRMRWPNSCLHSLHVILPWCYGG